MGEAGVDPVEGVARPWFGEPPPPRARHEIKNLPSRARGFSNQRYDAFALGSKGATFEALSETSSASTPNSSATRFRRLATSPEIAALADSTSRIAVNAAWRSLALSGNSFRIAASAPS